MGRNFLNIRNNLFPSTLRDRYSVLLGTTRGKGSSPRIYNFIKNHPEDEPCNINNWVNSVNENIEWERLAMSYNGQIQSAVVFDGNIYTSTDYGQTWTPSPQNFSLKWFCIAMSDDGKYQSAVSQEACIYTSDDYGKTWIENTTTPRHCWVSNTMSGSGQYQTAVANGYYDKAYTGYIYVSSDYGKTWNIQFPYNNCWTAIAMSNNGQLQTAVSLFIDGVIDPHNVMGYVYNSSDYGMTWYKNRTMPVSYYTCVDMSGDGKYQVIGVNNCNFGPSTPGPIFMSYNYGITYQTSSCPYDTWLNACINNSGSIIIVSSWQQTDAQNNVVPDTGKMMVSYDYGVSWQRTNAPLNRWTSAIISENNCVASATAWNSGIYIASSGI
jgi:photosystem II stability/assembly factor-like uncharacterized protein